MSEIVTYTGRVVDPLYLNPDKVNIIDIAHSLANQCRFTGHVREFYSVAQHSVLVAEYVMDDLDGSSRLGLSGLLHDASEAYLSDLARPVKHALGFGEAYREVEERLQRTISQAFHLKYPFPDIVIKVDDALLAAEQRDLMPRYRHIDALLDYPYPIAGWLPEMAKARFLALYTELTGETPRR